MTLMPEIETYDDGAFTVYQTRWKTYASRDKEGNGLCSGIDKEADLLGRDTLPTC